MFGCIAWAESEEIKIDEKEMVDVKWFTREECLKGIEKSKTPLNLEDKEFRIPGSYAIAHKLIAHWVNMCDK